MSVVRVQVHGKWGGEALVDYDDLPILGPVQWYGMKAGYVRGKLAGREVLMHRLLMGEPDGFVDHIDGDPRNCRRSNLRVTTNRVNQANRRRPHPRNTSGERGVQRSPNGKRWVAVISFERRPIHLGTFDTIPEAVAARVQAEHHYFGEACPR